MRIGLGVKDNESSGVEVKESIRRKRFGKVERKVLWNYISSWLFSLSQNSSLSFSSKLSFPYHKHSLSLT